MGGTKILEVRIFMPQFLYQQAEFRGQGLRPLSAESGLFLFIFTTGSQDVFDPQPKAPLVVSLNACSC